MRFVDGNKNSGSPDAYVSGLFPNSKRLPHVDTGSNYLMHATVAQTIDLLFMGRQQPKS
ncbi:hypothetical protein [Undibacterium sp. SXout20W]|uniref:hypothetical protein n=1 Tax=Undibacterium sp. SXout20W TaxID=3413051 RepID=UPI003BF2A42B